MGIGWQSKNSIFNLLLFFFCDWIHFFLLRLNLASILKKESKIWKKKKQKISNFHLEFFSDYFFSFFLWKYSQNNLVQVLCFFFFFFLLVFCFSLKCLNKLLTLFRPELLLKDSFNKDFCLIEEFGSQLLVGQFFIVTKKILGFLFSFI